MQMKTYSLSIPKPCHQGWDTMIPGDKGRYCLSCAKTVTDFSVMTDEAIQQYFLSSGGQSVCGRFKNIQLERIRIQLPGYFFQKRIAVWQKFLVIFLICFGGNFFSIDVLLGDSKALYAQVAGNGTHTKNSKRKKAGHKQASCENKISDFVWINSTTDGIVHIEPRETPSLAGTTNEPGKNDKATTVSISGDITSNPDKKPREEKLPKQPEAFMLPAIVRLRKRGGK
jgi:hypothetical protein